MPLGSKLRSRGGEVRGGRRPGVDSRYVLVFLPAKTVQTETVTNVLSGTRAVSEDPDLFLLRGRRGGRRSGG